MSGKPRAFGLLVRCAGIVLLAALIAVAVPVARSYGVVRFETPYQAVLLKNGQLFYGKLQGFGTRHPVLTEVYFVHAAVDPVTHQPGNTLVRRDREWHSPDRMLLNPDQIVLVDPVSPNSRLAELIVELRNR